MSGRGDNTKGPAAFEPGKLTPAQPKRHLSTTSPNRAIFQRVLVRRKRARQFQRLEAKLVSHLTVDDARA